MDVITPVQDVAQTKGRVVSAFVFEKGPPPSPSTHEFVAVVSREDEGGYSVFALNYPGVISQGGTLEEVAANIAEAFAAMLEARRSHGEDMQFTQGPALDIPANSKRIRIKFDG